MKKLPLGWIFLVLFLAAMVVSHHVIESHLYTRDVSSALLSGNETTKTDHIALLGGFLFLRLLVLVILPPLILTVIASLIWKKSHPPEVKRTPRK